MFFHSPRRLLVAGTVALPSPMARSCCDGNAIGTAAVAHRRSLLSSLTVRSRGYHQPPGGNHSIVGENAAALSFSQYGDLQPQEAPRPLPWHHKRGPSLPAAAAWCARRWQSGRGDGGSGGWDGDDADSNPEWAQGAFADATPPGASGGSDATFDADLRSAWEGSSAAPTTGLGTGAVATPVSSFEERLGEKQPGDDDIVLERLPRPPAKFDLLTTTNVFKWKCTAKQARKISGPMREWSDELQCRTGVHVHVEPLFPDKAAAGDYASPDDVETIVYFFGSDKAVQDALPFVRAMLKLDPCYVRLALYRRKPSGDGVEWLTLRRINKESRPADIPPISLKTPGKWTMLFESLPEAAIRSTFEETGVEVDPGSLTKTNLITNSTARYWWRPTVHYFISEVPYDVKVLGPQSATRSYVLDWDNAILRQSVDAIDRAWAQHADPKTGCAWLAAPLIDELQKPVKAEDQYMALRYTPSVESGLQDIIGLK